MNRTELQQLSEERIDDASSLLAASRWSAAYYLTGYALECALKSCVLAYIERTGIIFEDKKFAEKCWTHDLETLVKQADLATERGRAIAANAQLGTNWLIAKDWSEATRYVCQRNIKLKSCFLRSPITQTESCNGSRIIVNGTN